MERSLITWSIPNMITIWLMLIGLFLIYAVGAQMLHRSGVKFPSMSAEDSPSNEGGY